VKLLVVCQHYWPEPFNVSESCEELVRRGHNVTVVTGFPNYPQGKIYKGYSKLGGYSENHNGVQIERSWLIPRGENLHGINKLKRIANYISFALCASKKANSLPGKFDVVIVFQYSPVLMAIPGLCRAKKDGIPCLLYCFDLWPEDILTGGMSRSGFPYKVMRKISKAIYSSADAIAVTSPDFEKYFEDELHINNVPFYYLPQYAELQFEEINYLQKSSGKEEINIVFAGNVGGNQAIDEVVKAASLLDKQDKTTIHIVGSGSRLRECEELKEKLSISNVVFHGRKNRLRTKCKELLFEAFFSKTFL